MSKHINRLAAPRVWSIPKKGKKWAVRARPGPHPIDRSLPLLMVVRDQLGFCDTNREGKKIIGSRKVMVDGKIVTDEKRPIGLMDVVSIAERGESYRVLLDARGRLRAVKIPDAKAKWKLVRIEDKTTVKGKRVQLNLHDGRNLLLEVDNFKSGDVLKIDLPGQKVISSYPLEKDHIAMVIGGQHSGKLCTIERIEVTRSSAQNLVWMKEGFSTTRSNVFVVGKKTPEITVPEASAI